MRFLPAWLISSLWPAAEWVLIQVLKLLESKYPGIQVVVDKVLEIFSKADAPSGAMIAEHLDSRFISK